MSGCFKVLEFKGLKVLKSKSIIPECLQVWESWALKSECLKVSRVLWSSGMKVRSSQGFRVSGSEGLRVSGSQGLRAFWLKHLKVCFQIKPIQVFRARAWGNGLVGLHHTGSFWTVLHFLFETHFVFTNSTSFRSSELNFSTKQAWGNGLV